MAYLQTTANFFARGSAKLELTPNSPAQRELVDTYTLRLWVAGQLVYDRVHSVRDWQLRHSYVEKIARAFTCVRELAGQEFLCASVPGLEPTHLSLMGAYLDAHWLRVVLAVTVTKRMGELVHVNLYLQQAYQQVGDPDHRSAGTWGEWAEMVSGIILCRPEDAAAFGSKLLDEMQAVERERIALGIPESDVTDAGG